MANSDSNLTAVDQSRESYADDAKARRVLLVDASGNVIKATRSRENFAGSAGSGNDGDANRVYTLTTSSAVEIVEVFKDGVLLIETTDYTIDNSAKTVTMLGATFDSQSVSVFYNV